MRSSKDERTALTTRPGTRIWFAYPAWKTVEDTLREEYGGGGLTSPNAGYAGKAFSEVDGAGGWDSECDKKGSQSREGLALDRRRGQGALGNYA